MVSTFVVDFIINLASHLDITYVLITVASIASSYQHLVVNSVLERGVWI